MAVFIFTLYALQFITFDERSWVHMHYTGMWQSVEIPFFARSLPVPQNLYVEYLIQIHIFLAMKYASF